MTDQDIKKTHLEKLAKPGIKYFTKDKTYIGNIEGRLELISSTSISSLNTLGNDHIFVGNSFNKPMDVPLSGDATIISSGELTLNTVNTNIGTWNNLTINAKGLVTAGSNLPYITLTNLSATSPIFYNNGTGIISSQAASSTLNGYITTGTQTITGEKTILGTGSTSASTAFIITDSSSTTTSTWKWKNDGILYLGTHPIIHDLAGLYLNIGSDANNPGTAYTYIRMSDVTAVYATEYRASKLASSTFVSTNYVNFTNCFQFISNDESGGGASTGYNFNTNSSYINAGSFIAKFQNSGTDYLTINKDGNVGIGISSANASAIVDITSTTKGLKFPNMTTTQKNAVSSPAKGLVVYDITLNKLCVYTGAWETITST